MDRFTKRIQAFQEKTPRRFDSLDSLVTAGIVDGVDICTPHADHHLSAIFCLKAGVPVLVEKPMGITMRAAKLILETARQTGTILSVAENSRRGLGQRAITWLFNQDKRIGNPQMFVINYITGPKLPLEPAKAPEPAAQVNWRNDKFQAGGGWTYDGGIHLMDSLLVYFGEITSVFAEQKTLVPAFTLLEDGSRAMHEREDVCIATFHFKNGMIGTWTWSFVSPGSDMMHIAFYCEKGYVIDHTAGGWTHTFGGGFIPSDALIYLPDGKTLSGRDLEVEYSLTLPDAQREILFPHGIQRSVAQECHEFIDCIRTGRHPEVDGVAGVEALAISTAVYESALLNQVVAIEDIKSGRSDAFQRPIDQHWGLV
jgi:predicted dehydrogenase